MGKKKKVVLAPPKTIEKIRNDLNSDGIKLYEFSNLPKEFISKELLHPDVCAKCDTFVAAVSGSPAEGREYMFIAGLRQDVDNGKSVTDLDPIVMVYNLSTNSPAPSGVAVFHGSFDGRTEVATSNSTYTVNTLQTMLSNKTIPFSKAPNRFTNAMHYVANKYKDNIDVS